MSKFKCWKEATRPHTLPVSTAGVIVALGYAFRDGEIRWVPAVLCFLFALLAQVVSNFANEYYDYVNGSDKKGREGFRRGVTEGDISPRAMKIATFATLAAACAVGCGLIPYGGWKLIAVGVAVAVFALAYSAGPYPLSRVGLGDVAVIVFFGLVPVTLTYYLQTDNIPTEIVALSFAIGLMGDNVLITNNYRDADDDRTAGKRTTVVLFGRKTASAAYLLFGLSAVVLTYPLWSDRSAYIIAPAAYALIHIITWKKIRRSQGAALNPLLGATARNMLVYSVLLTALCVIQHLQNSL